MELQNVVLVDGVRSPFARGGRGMLVATRLDETAALVLRNLMERNPKVPMRMVEDVGLGNVQGVAELILIGANIAARLAGFPLEVCAFDSNRQCGSSMETMHRIAQSIQVGATECGIALGVERMGRALVGGGNGVPKNRVTETNKRIFQITAEQRNLAHDHDDNFSVKFPDYILDSPSLTSMTQTAQNVAEIYGMTREEMDEFAVVSHRKCAEAYDKGIYKDEVLALEVEQPVFDDQGNWLPDEKGKMVTFDRDECLRPGTNIESLSQLNPIKGIQSFGEKEIVITAGNSCPTNDGISAALLMSEKKAMELGLEPLARLAGYGVAGVKPQVMGLGPRAFDEEGDAPRRHHRRPDRPRGVQRGVRCAGDPELQGARDPDGQGERERRLAGDRPPARRDGRSLGDDRREGAATLGRQVRPGDAVHRRRHGHLNDRRGAVSEGRGNCQQIRHRVG